MTTATIDTTGLFAALDNAANELVQLISAVDMQKINLIPFKGSWTAAQLIVHVTKSNKAIAQALNMEGNVSSRNIDEGVAGLKKMFLDFNIKYKSPEFIIPEEGSYNKDEIIESLKRSVERLQAARDKQNLPDVITLPPFGEITKLELLHFVLYHTMRHIHQLKNIIHPLKSKN
jgi:hypothetical protein